MRFKLDNFKAKLHQRKSDNSLCSFLTTCFVCLFIHSLHFLTLKDSSKHKTAALLGERWTTAFVLLQRGREALALLSPARCRVGYAGSVLWHFKSREGLFFKTALSVAGLTKSQNCEGLETEMAKRVLERRLHPALLGHFCFQCCYLRGGVPNGDHSFWTVTGS